MAEEVFMMAEPSREPRGAKGFGYEVAKILMD
jgi:hypothetical protein